MKLIFRIYVRLRKIHRFVGEIFGENEKMTGYKKKKYIKVWPDIES